MITRLWFSHLRVTSPLLIMEGRWRYRSRSGNWFATAILCEDVVRDKWTRTKSHVVPGATMGRPHPFVSTCRKRKASGVPMSTVCEKPRIPGVNKWKFPRRSRARRGQNCKSGSESSACIVACRSPTCKSELQSGKKATDVPLWELEFGTRSPRRSRAHHTLMRQAMQVTANPNAAESRRGEAGEANDKTTRGPSRAGLPNFQLESKHGRHGHISHATSGRLSNSSRHTILDSTSPCLSPHHSDKARSSSAWRTPTHPIGTNPTLPAMATTTLTPHTGAQSDVRGAHVFPYTGSEPCRSTANEVEIETMADHELQRKEMMMRWKELGDRMIDIVCSDEEEVRPTRRDRVRVPAPPATPEKANEA